MLEFLADFVMYTLLEGLIHFFYTPAAPRRRWVLRGAIAAFLLFFAAARLAASSTAPFNTVTLAVVALVAALPAIAFFFGELKHGNSKLGIAVSALFLLALLYTFA